VTFELAAMLEVKRPEPLLRATRATTQLSLRALLYSSDKNYQRASR